MAKDFQLSLTIKAVTEGFDQIVKNLDSVAEKAKKFGDEMKSIGQNLTLKVTAPLALLGTTAVKSFNDQQQALAKLRNTLNETGRDGSLSLEQLVKQADELQKNSLFNDEDILGDVTSSLLRFGNVSDEIFPQAQQLVLDISQSLGRDLQSTAIAVGKALDDPAQALNSLSRAGVLFTDEQQKLINSFVTSGNLAKAQTTILEILASKGFNGAALAAQNAVGPLDRLKDSFDTFKETIGGILRDFIDPIASGLADLFDRFNDLSPTLQRIVVFFGLLAAAVGPVTFALGTLVSALPAIITGFTILAGPAGLIALLVGGLLAAKLAFGDLSTAAKFFALTINQYVLKAIEIIEKIPTSLAVIVPVFGVLKLAAAALKSTIEDNIESLNRATQEAVDNQQTQQKAEEGGEKLGAAHRRGIAKGLGIPDPGPGSSGTFALNLPVEIDPIPVDETNKRLTDSIKAAQQRLKDLQNTLSDVGQILTDSFTNAFTNIITGTENVADAFKNLGRSILASIFNAAIRSALGNLFLGLGFSQAGIGNIPAIGGLQAAEGGHVSGPGSATSDSIPAMLSNGEFVMPAKRVTQFGVQFFEMLRRGMMPAFASGGYIKNFGNYLGNLPRFADGGFVNQGQQNPNVSVQIINQSSANLNAKQVNQSVDVRGAIIQILLEDQKTNGKVTQGFSNMYGLKR